MKNFFKTFLIFTVLAIMFFSPQMAKKAAAAVCYSKAGGLWRTAATWNCSSGTYPAAGSKAYINSTHVVSVPTGEADAADTLTFVATSTAGSVQVVGSGSLAVSGTIEATSTTAANSAGNLGGTGSITASSMTVGTVGITPTGSRTVTLTSTSTSLTITNGITTNCTIGASGSGRQNSPIISLQTGSMSVGGNISLCYSTSSNGTAIGQFLTNGGNQNGILTLWKENGNPWGITAGAVATLNGTSATVKYSGTVATVLAAAYENLTLNGGGTVTIDLKSIGGDFMVSGTTTVTMPPINMTVTGALGVDSGATLNTAATSTLIVTNQATATGTIAHAGSGNTLYNGLLTINSGGNITNTGTGNITFQNGLTNNSSVTSSFGINGVYFNTNNQTVGGINSITIASTTISAIAVTNNLSGSASLIASTTLTGTGVLIQGTNANLNIGVSSIGSSLWLNATSSSGNTVTYNSAWQSQTVENTTYTNLTINKSGQTATLGGATTVNNALTISAGTLDVDNTNNYSLTLNGDYTNKGTFSARSGTVTIGGSAQQNFYGSMTSTSSSAFYNLTITNSSGSYAGSCGAVTPSVIFYGGAESTNNYTVTTNNVRIQHGAGLTYTFKNINWSAASSNQIFFGSSAGSAWLLNVSGTQTAVHYVDVSYSNASSGSAINASDGTNTDCLNNSNWTFTAPFTFTVDFSSVNIGTFTPGSPISSSTVLTINTTNSTGYKITLNRASTTPALFLTTNTTQTVSDTPNGNNWTAPATSSTVGPSAAWTNGTTIGLGFRIKKTGTVANTYSSNWWGTDDTSGNALYSGIPTSTAAQTIVNSVWTGSGTNENTTVEYKIDSNASQESGSYISSPITFTATANP